MSKRILVVEDQEDLRAILRDFLSASGYTVIEAVDGAESVAKAASDHPDLVLMDIQLPVLDGYDAAANQGPAGLAAIPIIAVSSFAMKGDEEKARASGCDDYVTKPYSPVDLLLTYLLQLSHESGLAEHLAFKGGTMLRKMFFGPRGRLSTDLDFTRRSDLAPDDLMILLLDALDSPYHGIRFHIADKDWYINDDACAANPVCSHADNERGIKIKIQVSLREEPILSVTGLAQVEQYYFRFLPFQPAQVPCLAFEEAVAEKIRASTQRSKIRDLHDLAELSQREIDRDRIRKLATLKLWSSGGQGLDYEVFRQRIEGSEDYDIGDLRNLLRRDQEPELKRMIDRTVDGFRFLRDLTDAERVIAADGTRKLVREAETLIAELLAPKQPN